MKLNNTFVIGTLVQFYELEMFEEHLKSCEKMLEGIENKENVKFLFYFSTQEYLEKIDWEYFKAKYERFTWVEDRYDEILWYNFQKIAQFNNNDCYPFCFSYWKNNEDEFYNIAAFRRDFNWKYQDKADLILWGETDSLWPSQTLQILDQLHYSVKEHTPKYVVNFADRRLWDNSFAPLHPMFNDVPFVDDEEWQFKSPASGKGYMSYEKMELINDIPFEEIKVVSFNEPRFDGSCVGFSSDLLKSGVNIPKSLIHNSEDVSIGKIAKKLLGDEFVQYNISNILHVHNRRHPKKRTGVLNENNPNGKCTVQDKGEWWKVLEDSSKFNYNNLFTQKSFIKMEEVMDKIQQKHPHLTDAELNELNQTYKNIHVQK